MPTSPCRMLLIPVLGDDHGQPTVVGKYDSFDAARVNADDCAPHMSTLSRCDYIIRLVSLNGRTVRTLPDSTTDAVWELAEERRHFGCIGARLATGESVAV